MAEGDYAFIQRRREMDVLDPAVQEQHRVNAAAVRTTGAGKQTAGDLAALEAILEI